MLLDRPAWFDEWTCMGEELENLAKEASSAGRHITASGFNLRACMYYQTGERFRGLKLRYDYEVPAGVAISYIHDWLAEKLKA